MNRRDEEIEAELRGATMTKPDFWWVYMCKFTDNAGIKAGTSNPQYLYYIPKYL